MSPAHIDVWVWAARYAALVHALRRTGGNYRRAAMLLGVGRNAPYVWLRQLR
jgi:transposase-like protein